MHAYMHTLHAYIHYITWHDAAWHDMSWHYITVQESVNTFIVKTCEVWIPNSIIHFIRLWMELYFFLKCLVLCVTIAMDGRCLFLIDLVRTNVLWSALKSTDVYRCVLKIYWCVLACTCKKIKLTIRHSLM